MKFCFKWVIICSMPLTMAMYLIGCFNRKGDAVVLDIKAKPLEKLSEYHFFKEVMSELKPAANVVPYDLITPLFSDYAHKARFVYVPQGMNVDYDTTKVLQFPVGACLIKNFFYPDDFRTPNGKRRIIETRLLVHRESGWEAHDYIWNNEQTEAMLEDAGDIKKVSWIHTDGTKHEIDYIIPSKNQCKGCHWDNGGSIIPIGPKIRNLNRDFAYEDGSENQIAHLSKAGILRNAPAPENAPKLAGWMDSAHYNLDARARAYLDVNCGHCHNAKGPAYTSGLHLNLDNTNLEHLGICKPPVAAGKGTGNRLFDIVPGNPQQSIMYYRMNATEPEVKMPELGRTLVHKEGLELIEKWIASMKASDCKEKQ